MGGLRWVGMLAMAGCGLFDGGTQEQPAGAELAADVPDRVVPEEAFPGKRGERHTARIRTPAGTRDVAYQDIEGWAVAEGDILLFRTDGPNAAAAVPNDTRVWPDCTVYYDFDGTVGNTVRRYIRDAADAWESATDLRFVEGGGPAGTILVTQPSSGCSSQVGRVGGQQELNLASSCGFGAAMHEMGHAIGLWHEQSREDRDDHVEVFRDNIEPGNYFNYQKYTERGGGQDIGPYNLDSIMHYGSNYWVIDPSRCSRFGSRSGCAMLTVNGGYISPNRSFIHAEDAAAINTLYAFECNFDRDGDGFDRPADCDDDNPQVPPRRHGTL